MFFYETGFILRETVKARGFSLLFVMFIMTIIMFWLTSVWQVAQFSFHIACQKKHYQQCQASLEGLLRYGIVFCKFHFFDLISLCAKDSFDYFLHFNKWPVGKDMTCQGRINIIRMNDEALQIKALLINSDYKKCVARASCMLRAEIADGDTPVIKSIEVSHWSISEE
jgi:hypothetical protein